MNNSKIKINEIIQAFVFFLLLVSYVYIGWPALFGPFVFDDFPNLQNLALLNNGVSLSNLGKYLASFTDSPGRPIAALSFLINDNAWPSEPFSFKYTNIFIHLLNSVLLFGMLRQLAKACRVLPQNIFWPLVVMAIWLFHPLQLSAQMLVVQRMTLLSALFCFAGLWAYITLLQKAKTTLAVFLAMVTLGIATILAFLCKENGALLPLFAWVLNATLLRNLLEEKSKQAQHLIFVSCALPSLLLFVSIFYVGYQPNAFLSREFNMLERTMTQAHVLTDYLKQIYIPQLSGSGIYFDDYLITRSLFSPISTLIYSLCIIASIVFALIFRKRFILISFAILWFFAGHVVESSILPLELYFEHRNYLPMLGPVLAISAVPFLINNMKLLAYSLLFVWFVMLSFITSLQATVWGNQTLMAAIWASEKPMSLRANQQLAKYFYDKNQPEKASEILLSTYDRGVTYSDLPLSSLIAKCWHPKISVPSDLYNTTLYSFRISPYSNSAIKSILLLRQAAQENQCEESITPAKWLVLTDRMLEAPKFKVNAEANIRLERAKLFIHQLNLDKTMSELERAYEVSPTVELSQKIAEVLLSAGLPDEAAKWLENGLKLKQPFFDSLMYDPKDYSRNLLKAIENSKYKQPDAVINKTK